MSNDWEAGEKESETPTVPRRSRAWLWAIPAVLIIPLIVYLALNPPQRETNVGISHPAVGQSLSGLMLEPLTGSAAPLRLDDLKGKVVLVNYWGTWCGPCQLEFPQLIALEKEMRKEAEFRFVSVSCGSDEESDSRAELEPATAAFLRSAKVDLPTYHDPQAASRRALVNSAKLQGFGYPTTVLLDRQGTIRALWSGFDVTFEREMQLAVRGALAKK